MFVNSSTKKQGWKTKRPETGAVDKQPVGKTTTVQTNDEWLQNNELTAKTKFGYHLEQSGGRKRVGKRRGKNEVLNQL